MIATEQRFYTILEGLESLVQNIKSDVELEDYCLVNKQLDELEANAKSFRFLLSRRSSTFFNEITEYDIQHLATLESTCRAIVSEANCLQKYLHQLKTIYQFEYCLSLELKRREHTIGELPLVDNITGFFMLKILGQQVQPELLIKDLLSVTEVGLSLNINISNKFLL